MRAAVSCVLALLLAGASFNIARPVRAVHCGTKNDYQPDEPRTKPSSFAPHPGPQSRVYGAPIQSRIFKSRPRKKPQLTSAPLPDSSSAKSSPGG
jgi:hypothetical protein